MTEYVILIGMLALGLMAIAERYKEQIRITIVGNKGMTGALDNNFQGGGFGGGSSGSGGSGGSSRPPANPNSGTP